MECLRARKKNVTAPSKDVKFVDINARFFSSSTTHGLGKIYSSKRYKTKILWGCVFLVMICLLIRSVVMLIKKIDSNAIVTEVRSYSKDVMQFPAITICNASPFRRSESMEALKGFSNNKSVNGSNLYLKYISLLSTVNTTQLYEMGHPPQDFLRTDILCQFNGRPCSYPIDFRMSTTSLSGNCYTFNFNGTLHQTSVGAGFGFSLAVNINQSDYYIAFPSLVAAGAVVSIHEPGEVPTYERQVLLGPGLVTRIAMVQKQIIRLPDPYPDNCSRQTFVSGVHKYSQSMCSFYCYMKTEKRLCGRVNPFILSYIRGTLDHPRSTEGYEPAKTEADFKCLQLLGRKFQEKLLTCDCTVPCNEKVYQLTLSSAMWPSVVYSDHVVNTQNSLPNVVRKWTLKDIRYNFLAMEIYFDSFSIEETRQKAAYDEDDFLSDFGGQLGLWLGASIFSAIEFGSFLLEILYHFVCKQRKHKTIIVTN